MPATDTYLTRTPDIMVWSVFVHIESDILVLERAAAQERERINELAGPNDGRDPRFGAPRARDAVAGGAPLLSLLKAHRQTVSRYQAMVQQEYQFFVVAAKNPVMQVGLYEATATTPAATAVLRYDLDAVTTQLRQEQAIATAEDAAARQVSHQLPASAATPSITAPVGGVVSQGFGSTSLALEPAVSYHGVFYEHFHTGIDIGNALDTPVGAAAPGRVILAGSSRDATGKLVGYGNYVVIDHGNGYVTLYGHLDQLVVISGQLVLRGQEIGLLGSTGWSTGPICTSRSATTASSSTRKRFWERLFGPDQGRDRIDAPSNPRPAAAQATRVRGCSAATPSRAAPKGNPLAVFDAEAWRCQQSSFRSIPSLR